MSSNRLATAKTAALLTGKQLLEHYQTGNRQGSLKKDHTLVTEADLAADRTLKDLIHKDFPEDQILSEESSTIYPNGQDVWVIDPLDGTVNFSLGIQYWGVSVAHLQNGVPQTAALYFPLSDELFSAELGQGAALNGNPLHVNKVQGENLFPVFVHCSRMPGSYITDLPYKKRSLGAAAYHLCLITNNTAVLAFESTVRIWDFAAAWLVIKEAGGVIESFNHQEIFPAEPGKDYQHTPFPIIAATSRDILEQARKNIKKR